MVNFQSSKTMTGNERKKRIFRYQLLLNKPKKIRLRKTANSRNVGTSSMYIFYCILLIHLSFAILLSISMF